MNAKEMEQKEEELSSAQECIEIIHNRLKEILLKKFIDIIEKQKVIMEEQAFEIIKINNDL